MRGQWWVVLPAAVGLAGLVAGCVSTGVKVSEQQATSFEVGKATYQEVVAKLGEPTTNTLSSDGTRVIAYSFSAAMTRPESFIPYIGGLVGGVNTRSSQVAFYFDAKGILLRTESSQGGAGVDTNLAAQPVAPLAKPTQ
jgi:hypothetical protein